jgi:hypothetical protein
LERKQITFYLSFYKAIRRIKKKTDRCDAYDALFDYAFSGIAPDLDNMPDAAAIAFELVKPNIDASNKKASSGSKGGTSKQSDSKPELNGKQTGSKTQANSKQSASKKENEKENKIEIEDKCLIGPETPAVISLPLNDGTEFGVTDSMVNEFTNLYPAVDVMQELRNMRGWLINNPKNRKTFGGIRRFINSWLSREQDKPRMGTTKQQNNGYVHGADRLMQMLERGDFDD